MQVRYEDGDEENLEWSDLEPTLVKHHNYGKDSIDYVCEGDVSFIENKQQDSLMSKSKASKSYRRNDGETRFGLGNKLIGRSLMKEFSGKVYAGKVVAYDGRRKLYKVKFDEISFIILGKGFDCLYLEFECITGEVRR